MVVSQENGTAEGLVPSGIIERSKSGLLVHEGNDNVYINTETIDGKNTYHSMARVIF